MPAAIRHAQSAAGCGGRRCGEVFFFFLLSLNEIRATRHVRQKHLVIMMFNLCYQLLKGRRFLGPSSDEDVTDPIYYLHVRVKLARVQV